MPRKAAKPRLPTPLRLAVGVPAVGALEFIRFVEARVEDPLQFDLQGGIFLIERRSVASIIPAALIRISGDEGPARLVMAHLAEQERSSTSAALERFGKAAGPNGFSITAGAADQTFGDLLRGIEKKQPLPLYFSVKLLFPGRRRPAVSEQIPGLLRAVLVTEIEEDLIDKFGNLAACPPNTCHEHWHWEVPYPETRWTECHGPCPAPKDCRCKAKPPGNPGFKTCWGWVWCSCV